MKVLTRKSITKLSIFLHFNIPLLWNDPSAHPPRLSLFRAFIHPFIHSCMHSYIHLSINQSIHRSIHPSVRPSIHPSIRPPVHLSIHPSIHHPSIHPSIRPSVRPSVRSSVRPSVRPLIRSFVRSFIHSFTHSLTHSFIHSFFYAFVRSFFFMYVHLFTSLFVHSLTIYSFNHPLLAVCLWLFVCLFDITMKALVYLWLKPLCLYNCSIVILFLKTLIHVIQSRVIIMVYVKHQVLRKHIAHVKQTAQLLKITCVEVMGKHTRITASTNWMSAKRAQTLPCCMKALVMVSDIVWLLLM